MVGYSTIFSLTGFEDIAPLCCKKTIDLVVLRRRSRACVRCLHCFIVHLRRYSVGLCSTDNTGSVGWYSPSRRPIRRQPEAPFTSHYEDYDYACSYGDRLPAPSPVYSRQGYVQRSMLGSQCDWYARGDGDGHFEPERFQDNGLQAPDGRSPYRQYDSSANRSRYYDEDGQLLDGGSFGYVGAPTASRLPDGQTRRNGGIGFDWTSAAADRKSAYRDDNMLIIGDDRPPFDYNVGTVQRRPGKTSTSPHHSGDLRSVDGMERRLAAELALHDKSEVASEMKLQPHLVSDHIKLHKPEVTSEEKRVSDGLERRHPVGTESVTESPYRKEKDRVQRESPHRGGTSSSAAAGKNGSHSRNRTKVDDIQRLTERDRVPAPPNRKQKNHVTPRSDRVPSPRVDESAKQSRVRDQKSSTTPASATSGEFIFKRC